MRQEALMVVKVEAPALLEASRSTSLSTRNVTKEA